LSKGGTDAAYHDGRFGASQQEPRYRALLHAERERTVVV
jgi:hypothetical protein